MTNYKDKSAVEIVSRPLPSCRQEGCHEEAHTRYFRVEDGGRRQLALTGCCSCVDKWNQNEANNPLYYPDWNDDVYQSQINKPAPQVEEMSRCEYCGSPRLSLHRWNDRERIWETPTGVCGCVPKRSYAEINQDFENHSKLRRILFARETIRREDASHTQADTPAQEEENSGV